MARLSRLSEWVSANTVVAIGAFMSGLFLLLGVLGSIVFFPIVQTWRSAESWPTTTAEITASRLASSTRGRGVRPEFSYRYTWQGQAYTTSGYDLLNVNSTNVESSHAVLRQHPVGSRTSVLVNPDRPAQAVLARGEAVFLFVYAVPPFFAVLGFIGALFTTAGWLGWFDEKSKHPVGRATRALGTVLLRERVLKSIFFAIVGSVILGLAVYGVKSGNVLLIFVAGVMIWGTWKASRTA